MQSGLVGGGHDGRWVLGVPEGLVFGGWHVADPGGMPQIREANCRQCDGGKGLGQMAAVTVTNYRNTELTGPSL